MNICLFRTWGLGILFAVTLSGCASLAPRDAAQPTRAPDGAPLIGSFMNPLPESRVISNFGPRGRRNHDGVDLRKSAAGGDMVAAAGAGTVETARRCRGYGLTVVIRHPDGSRTRYAHLKKLLVEEDQQVAAGQHIGIVGATGNATAPHLHFEILTALGRCVDPVPYLQTVAVVQSDRLTRQTAKAVPPLPDESSAGLPEEVRSTIDFCKWNRKWQNADPSFSVNKFERISGQGEDDGFSRAVNSINAAELSSATKVMNAYAGVGSADDLKVYSPDRTKFIWNAGYPDPLAAATEVILFDVAANTSRHLLSFCPGFRAEKVFWVNNNKFMVIAMGEIRGSKGADAACYYQHTLYLYDLEKNAVARYLSPDLVPGDKSRNSRTIQAAAAKTGRRRSFSK